MIHNFKKQVELEIALAGNALKSTVQVKGRGPYQEEKEKTVLSIF